MQNFLNTLIRTVKLAIFVDVVFATSISVCAAVIEYLGSDFTGSYALEALRDGLACFRPCMLIAAAILVPGSALYLIGVAMFRGGKT